MKKIILILFVLITGFGLNAQVQKLLKPYDYLVAKLKYPTYGAAQFKYGELTPENTQFLSSETYKSLPKIRKLFSKNGKFDEDLGNRFYELISEEWDRFCYESFEYNARIEVIPDPYDYSAPINVKVIYCNGCTFWKVIK